MRTFWTASAGVIATLVTALVIVVSFPHRFFEIWPAWLQEQYVLGGPQVLLEVEPDGVDLQQAVEESIRIIDLRLAELGTRGLLRQQGATQILLRLPPSANAQRSIELATRRAKLEFRLIDTAMTVAQAIADRPPQHSEVLYDVKKVPYLVEKEVLVSGRDIVDAQPAFDARTREPVINFGFNSSGTSKFGQATQANVGRPIALVFDSQVLFAPVIRDPILGGRGQILGDFTIEEAVQFAILLRTGELPGRLVVIDGPSFN
jgi:protein-export membrane protein SecD